MLAAGSGSQLPGYGADSSNIVRAAGVAHSGVMRGEILCISLVLLGCGPPPSDHPAGSQTERPALFREVAAESGLTFRHFADASDEFRLPEIMGSGVALLDYDLDGDLDAYFLQGGPLGGAFSDAAAAGHGVQGPGSRLFENRIVPTGELFFEDVTEESGLRFGGYAMGAAVGDYDGDGDPDLYVTALGPNALFRNDGDGTFTEVDGPQDQRWSTSATFWDYDQDGDLDLFFANYVDFTARNNKKCFSPVGARDHCNPTVYNPVPDRLFRNDGGRFRDVTGDAGLGAAFGNGLGVMSVDLSGDGRPDLYVANDGTANQLWINQGGGRFENTAMLAGAAVNADGRAEAGMGVVAADFDNDGDDDVFLTHNTLETNTLYLNNGSGLFQDATNRFGLGGPSVPFTGFGVSWADFDHDGRLDVFVANGAVTVMESLRGQRYPYLQDNQHFRGTATGFEAVDGEHTWGDVSPLASRGVATGDLDMDGDPDLVVSNSNGPARIYINQTDDGRWLRIKLAARAGNPAGLGARVGLSLGDGTMLWRRLHRDGSYLSSSEAAVHFGLAANIGIESAEVVWPEGRHERFPAPRVGETTALREGEGRPASH